MSPAQAGLLLVMFWKNVLENALGNFASDVVVGIFLATAITGLIARRSELGKQSSVIAMLDLELQLIEMHLVTVRDAMIGKFDELIAVNRIDPTPAEYTEAVKSIRQELRRTPVRAFEQLYPDIGLIRNAKVIESIVGFYGTRVVYKFQFEGFSEQVNAELYKEYRRLVSESVDECVDLQKQLQAELDSLARDRTLRNLIGYFLSQWLTRLRKKFNKQTR